MQTPGSVKRISLQGIHEALRDFKHNAHVDFETARCARQSLRAMLELPAGEWPPFFDLSRQEKSVEFVPV